MPVCADPQRVPVYPFGFELAHAFSFTVDALPTLSRGTTFCHQCLPTFLCKEPLPARRAPLEVRDRRQHVVALQGPSVHKAGAKAVKAKERGERQASALWKIYGAFGTTKQTISPPFGMDANGSDEQAHWSAETGVERVGAPCALLAFPMGLSCWPAPTPACPEPGNH